MDKLLILTWQTMEPPLTVAPNSRNGDQTPQAERSVTGCMNAVNTKRLSADGAGIGTAADILGAGGLVAFPTETVYGLGANARNTQAVARVFEAKGRPSFNPLIVHVPNLAAAEEFGVFSDAARALVGERWPNALSLVVPSRPEVGLSPLVTAGLDSVALRVPTAPLALALLEAFGGPIAAPSANPSGRISPTTADHVLNGLHGKIEAVLDGGATTAGLESTIIGVHDDCLRLLREGAYVPAVELLRDTYAEDAPRAPGQLASHYAPKASVRLDATEAEEGEFLIGFGPVAGDLTLSANGDLVEAAARLYAALHEADAKEVTRLAVAPIPDHGLGRAINDRLRRAAAPRDS